MAIKGKKKAQQRGSQGARRPASAPRPAPAPRRKTPWYRTRDGMLILGIFLIVLAGLGVWLVASARERAAETQARADAIDQYTAQLTTVLEGATEQVTEMNLLGVSPDDDGADQVAADAEDWLESLRATQAEIVQLFPEREIEPVNQLFNETLSLYISSAQTLSLLPEVRGDTRQRLFARAADQRDTATAVWGSAIGVLDQMRRDHGLTASGLRPPAPAAPSAEEAPIELPEPEAEAPDDGTIEEPEEGDDGTMEGPDELDDGVPESEEENGGG